MIDADRLLIAAMDAQIELAATRAAIDPGARYRPGQPLRLLLAGYSGTRNTGADVRVEEMIRQLRHLVGDEHLSLSILTFDGARSRGYFRTVQQLHLQKFFPPMLAREVHAHHGVVACEGSMFKSKFANALSTMMVGALGLALVEGKLAVGYGGEAGAMDPPLRELVRKHCPGALILTRNEESRGVLSELGVESRAGTDTAWTFEPAPPVVGRALLERAGWDGTQRILVVCPIHPFWWPVRPDVKRGLLQALTGGKDPSHYTAFYFHHDDAGVRAKYERYLDAMAAAVGRARDEHGVMPVVVGMERLDRQACEDLAARLGGAPVFTSDEHDTFELVAILREASALLASRYHAIVTSMPAGVPSAGVTMDERIRNLMADRGQSHLCFEVSDPELAERATVALRALLEDGETVTAGIERCVVANLVRMGEMGRALVDHLREKHPALPLRAELGGTADPWLHLPEMTEELEALVARVGVPARAMASATSPAASFSLAALSPGAE